MMPSVFESYKSGVAARQAETAAKSTEEYKGLQMEAVRSDMRSRKAASVRQAGMDQAYQSYATGDTAGAKEQFAGLGKEGRAALGDIGKSEKATREQALADLKTWGPAAMQMAQGPERETSDLWLAKTMQDAGAIGAGVARAYLNSDPETKDAILGAISGGDESRIPGDWVTYDKPDGTSILMNEADPEDQNVLKQNRDWTKAPTKTEVRTGELPKAEETKLRDYENTTSSFIQRGQSILDLLKENPEANTVVSVLEKTGANLMTEANQLAKDAGFAGLEEEIKGYDEAGTSSFLEKQGITSARMKGQVVALAYMQAKIFDKGGRVTDKDFKFALQALGANNSNPKAFAATLEDQMRLAEEGFKSDYSRRMGEEYTGAFGSSGGIPAPENVAEGQEAIQNGVTYVNRGGFMVPKQ